MTGEPTTTPQCFLPCTTDDECGNPSRLYCDPLYNVCVSGSFFDDVGSLGGHKADGSACETLPSPAPEPTRFGPNVNASDPSQMYLSEPHIAVDPTDNQLVYVAYNSDVGTTISASRDQGHSWHHYGVGSVDPDDGGDPTVAVDPTTHDLWHAYLTNTPADDSLPDGGLDVTPRPRATAFGSSAPPTPRNGDLSLQHPIDANDPAVSDGDFLDKPWMTVAPDGTLYVSYTIFHGDVDAEVALSISQNQGASWRHLFFTDAAGRALGPQFSQIVTDAAGKLYAVWLQGSASDTSAWADILFTGLAGPSAPLGPRITVTTGDATFDDPQIAVTAKGDIVYVVYGATAPGAAPEAQDLRGTFSTDGGATFAPTVKLNDDATCATHWHPALVTDAEGALWMTSYDNRYGDQRVGWLKAKVQGNQLVVTDRGYLTDAAPAFTTSRINFFLGDYNGLAYAGDKLFAAWGDLRSASTAGTQIYFALGAATP